MFAQWCCEQAIKRDRRSCYRIHDGGRAGPGWVARKNQALATECGACYMLLTNQTLAVRLRFSVPESAAA
jgi:hypothetical protein